jgi:hypothetical protein
MIAGVRNTGIATDTRKARMAVETVIINCSTREQAALALVSALQRGRLPVTVIDCQSTDGSYAFFRRLQDRLPFKLVQMPLRRHGDSLDRIFNAATCDTLLLLDSDAEILLDDLVPRLVAALDEDTYGSGFLHAGTWLPSNHLVAEEIGYYAPRMWIPCVLLKVAPIRAALRAGQSFHRRIVGNEIARLRWLSQLLYLRFRVPVLRRMTLDRLRPLRGSYFGLQPHYLYYDTGAMLHDHLRNEQRLRFADLGADFFGSAVRHHHGVTRRRLKRGMRNAADIDETRSDAIERIETIYGVAVPELKSR